MRNFLANVISYILIGLTVVLLGIFDFFLTIGKLYYKCMYFITSNPAYKWHAEHIKD